MISQHDPRARREQQQTQAVNDAGSGNRTRATCGKRALPDHGATLASQSHSVVKAKPQQSHITFEGQLKTFQRHCFVVVAFITLMTEHQGFFSFGLRLRDFIGMSLCCRYFNSDHVNWRTSQKKAPGKFKAE